VDAGANDDVLSGGRKGIAHGGGLGFTKRLSKISTRHYAGTNDERNAHPHGGSSLYDPPELHAAVDACCLELD
jgi:hypothetical protein